MPDSRPHEIDNPNPMLDVSVVMGVFNGASSLAATLESVLAQEGCAFEFIVINDGSTDATAGLLDDWARGDSRLRVVHQPNRGLTQALIRGCNLARGTYIARQDCGDLALPGRLARQCAYLAMHPEVVVLASAVRYIGPANEPLFETYCIGDKLHVGLSALDVTQIKGPPHHGGTMFRRAAYLEVGGYRAAFLVAQDIDLWLRLWERGRCVGEAEIGYEATLAPGSISARRRPEQLKFAALAIDCARARRQGGGDGHILANRRLNATGAKSGNPRLDRARFFYYVGSCLRRRDPEAAKRYLLQSFQEYPLFLKGLVRYVLVRM
jgi:glycosyltransferase involved in cell wall biosynthesis